MKEHKKHVPVTAWPGQSGNPAGRPLGARARISEKLESVLHRLAISDPGKLAQIAYRLCPVTCSYPLSSALQAILSRMKGATLPRVLDIIQASVPDGAEPGAVFETIEHALRAEYANKIEST